MYKDGQKIASELENLIKLLENIRKPESYAYCYVSSSTRNYVCKTVNTLIYFTIQRNHARTNKQKKFQHFILFIQILRMLQCKTFRFRKLI